MQSSKITTNQAATIALFRVINRYVGNLPPMPGVFPDLSRSVIRNTDTGRELVVMRWDIPALVLIWRFTPRLNLFIAM